MAGFSVPTYGTSAPIQGLMRAAAYGPAPTAVSWRSAPMTSRGVQYNNPNLSGLVPGSQAATQAALQQNQAGTQAQLDSMLKDKQFDYEKSMLQAKRGWAQEDQGLAMQMLDKYGSGSFGGGTPARVSSDDSAWNASMAGAFGKAKDLAADAVGAARRSMIGNMTARGIGGSGIENANERAIQIAGAGQLGQAGRDIAAQTANRQAQINDRNYAGDITQRGQDITAQGQRLSFISPLFSLLRAAY